MTFEIRTPFLRTAQTSIIAEWRMQKNGIRKESPAAWAVKIAIVLVTTSSCFASELSLRSEQQETEPTALVRRPCPPSDPTPEALASRSDSLLNPGKVDVDALANIQSDEVQRYLKNQAEQRKLDWPNLCKYRELNAAVETPPRVVLLGDSITENWPRGDPTLFDKKKVIGRGISGQTTPQMLLRFYDDVIGLRPRMVHIIAGTNDIAGNTGPTTVQDYKNNIMAMVDLARAHGIRVALGSIPPASAFWWRPAMKPANMIVSLNRWLRSYAAQNHITFVDYYSVLADSDGSFKPTLSNDGVHPNRNGYVAMRAVALHAMASELRD